MANVLKVQQQDSITHLAAAGWSIRRIARTLQLDRKTVRRYLRAGGATYTNEKPPKSPPISTAGSEGGAAPISPTLSTAWPSGSRVEVSVGPTNAASIPGMREVYTA